MNEAPQIPAGVDTGRPTPARIYDFMLQGNNYFQQRRFPLALLRRRQEAVTAKPTVSALGIDLAAQVWHRSGRGDGAIEVAFARAGDPPVAAPATPGEWVLMRVAGDPEQRVLVFDRHEWECFLDGARNGEFDDAAAGPQSGISAAP